MTDTRLPFIHAVVKFVPTTANTDGQPNTAVVTAVDGTTVTLYAIVEADGDASNAGPHGSVPFDAAGVQPYSWHWPAVQ